VGRIKEYVLSAPFWLFPAPEDWDVNVEVAVDPVEVEEDEGMRFGFVRRESKEGVYRM
jgi:hypothetical protein